MRLLTNLETEKQKLIHIILFGQPELDELLKKKAIRQLQQRISFSYCLASLNKQQIRDYLVHRLQIAGNSHTDLLQPSSIYLLYFFSQGIPRLINILTHKALLAAYGKGHSTISWRHIYLAAMDTDDTRQRLHFLFSGKIFKLLLVLSLLSFFLLGKWS